MKITVKITMWKLNNSEESWEQSAHMQLKRMVLNFRGKRSSEKSDNSSCGEKKNPAKF